MRTKFGSFYADWRDQHGRRHMKAFPTKKQARAYAAKQRKLVAAKKAPASRPSKASSRPGRKATRRATRASKPASASASA